MTAPAEAPDDRNARRTDVSKSVAPQVRERGTTLTGTFGSYSDPKYAMVLGLIPDCRLNRASAIGSAAGTGARMALVNREHRAEMEALVRRIEKIETALETRFQEHFVHAMALPNGIDPFPHLAAAVALPARNKASAEGRRRGGRRRGG